MRASTIVATLMSWTALTFALPQGDPKASSSSGTREAASQKHKRDLGWVIPFLAGAGSGATVAGVAAWRNGKTKAREAGFNEGFMEGWNARKKGLTKERQELKGRLRAGMEAQLEAKGIPNGQMVKIPHSARERIANFDIKPTRPFREGDDVDRQCMQNCINVMMQYELVSTKEAAYLVCQGPGPDFCNLSKTSKYYVHLPRDGAEGGGAGTTPNNSLKPSQPFSLPSLQKFAPPLAELGGAGALAAGQQWLSGAGSALPNSANAALAVLKPVFAQ